MFAFLSADSSFTGSSNLGLKKQKIYDERFILSIFWGRIGSSGSVLDCWVEGYGFDSRGTNIQGLKITEKWRDCLYWAKGLTFIWLRWPHKMAVLSPVRDLKIVFSILLVLSYFHTTIDFQINCFFKCNLAIPDLTDTQQELAHIRIIIIFESHIKEE